MEHMPKDEQLMWPTLKSLKVLGGSGSNEEILDKIIELEGYSQEIQQFPHPEKNMSMLDYRCAWARTYLKRMGAITNSSKGVWIILPEGESLSEAEMFIMHARVKKAAGEKKKQEKIEQDLKEDQRLSKHSTKDQVADEIEDVETREEGEETWKEELIENLLQMSPSGFERVCQRILRESGFTKVEVTGKTGDGGIDGKGILRVNLVSFHVYFQSKRWRGSVGAPDIRNFRGAVMGRADKGLFITTGTFTSDARKEAIRDGASAIDLIDGQDLCDLLKSLKLGVGTELIEKVSIDKKWFEVI